MRIEEVKVLKYEELDEPAKEKARQWFRKGMETDDWSDCVCEDFKMICECIGVELDTHAVKLMNGTYRYDPNIYFSGFSSQGDGACFEGAYRTKTDAGKAIREHAPQDEELHGIADELVKLSAEYPEGVVVKVCTSGRYSHANTMTVATSEANEVCDSEDNWESPELSNDVEFLEQLRNLANWLYSRLQKEYEWLTSDEVTAENIIANEYEFTEDGERWL